jgi:hypothetical protein
MALPFDLSSSLLFIARILDCEIASDRGEQEEE